MYRCRVRKVHKDLKCMDVVYVCTVDIDVRYLSAYTVPNRAHSSVLYE